MKRVFPDFSKTFSLKNKGFGVLKKGKGSFLIFQRLFIEEQMIWSSKKTKMVFPDFSKTFSLKNKGCWSPKKRKRVSLDFFSLENKGFKVLNNKKMSISWFLKTFSL